MSASPPRRIMAIWFARLAIDRWRQAHGCGLTGGGDTEAPLAAMPLLFGGARAEAEPRFAASAGSPAAQAPPAPLPGRPAPAQPPPPLHHSAAGNHATGPRSPARPPSEAESERTPQRHPSPRAPSATQSATPSGPPHGSAARARPALAPEAEHPLVLVTETAHGPRIDAANQAGLAAGARPGMMLADARTLCPQLAVAPSDPAGDLAFLERLALWAQRWGPWSAIDAPDGLLVDVTAVAHLFGGEDRLLADVERRCGELGAGRGSGSGSGRGAVGLTARAAIAPTAGAAWALARYGPPRAILGSPPVRQEQSPPASSHATDPPPSAHAERDRLPSRRHRKAGEEAGDRAVDWAAIGAAMPGALADLPVAALRLDADVLLVLRRLGIKRLGQLAAIEADPDGTGDTGAGEAAGRDALQRRFRHRRSPAANPLIRLDQLLGRVPEPLLPVVATPPALVQRRLLEPIRHRDPLNTVLHDLAEDMARALEGRGEGARRLELGLWRVDGEVVTRRLEFAAATRDAGHICRLFATRLDDVDAGFGIEMVRMRASWAEPLGLAQADLDAAAEEHGTSLAACLDRLAVRLGEGAVRRPVVHASHIPERAQRWQAPLALQPASQEELAFHARPLKILDQAEKIAVLYATPDGFPRQFRWRGRLHEVLRVEGPERIAPEWWREKGSTRLRDYYRIEDDSGRRYWIYRLGLIGDGRGGLPEWFLQGAWG